MNKRVRKKMKKRKLDEAIQSVFGLQLIAASKQKIRGATDVGKRAGVTAGQHFKPLETLIKQACIEAGVKKELIYTDKGLELPGWYRPNKKWDILVFDGKESNKSLVSAIELKSMNGSFGNNFNNRAEEALGSATDVLASLKHNLYSSFERPLFGYVLVIKSDEDSTKKVKNPAEPHFKVCSDFYGTSYIERFTILCKKMLAEKLYDAIWLVTVNDNGEVSEPVPELSYKCFLHKLKSHITLFKLNSKSS